MNGYLMQEADIVAGEDNFIESRSPENQFGVVFEDNGETGYFYAIEMEKEGDGYRILDALHIYEGSEFGKTNLKIVWSRDWLKCALVLDGYCHAIFDFAAQGGYNINEFPPLNSIWTKGGRKLTNELIKSLF
ncbi:MAG: DUF2251 domain-containing protein [Chitinophagaceae bacterium]|nr:DUF2251 domain-containing protein [Chitinophagaceae bacterium]